MSNAVLVNRPLPARSQRTISGVAAPSNYTADAIVNQTIMSAIESVSTRDIGPTSFLGMAQGFSQNKPPDPVSSAAGGSVATGSGTVLTTAPFPWWLIFVLGVLAGKALL